MVAKLGRPKGSKSAAPAKRAYQVKLPPDEADAFDAYVRQRSESSMGSSDMLSAAAVLRMLVRDAVAAAHGAKPLAKGKAVRP
jgi:hypothetical protein